MSELKISTDHNMVVQTDPTIAFSNGMVLWLGEKGEKIGLEIMPIDSIQWRFYNEC